MPALVVAGVGPGLAVDGNVLNKLLGLHHQKVCQHVGAQPSGKREGFRRRACGHPHLGFALHWRWKSFHFNQLTVTANRLDRLAAPERLHGFDAAGHQLTAVLVVFRLQHEVAGVPSGGEAQSHPAVGQVVHDGPFLRHADRIVQRQDDAPGPDADALG